MRISYSGIRLAGIIKSELPGACGFKNGLKARKLQKQHALKGQKL